MQETISPLRRVADLMMVVALIAAIALTTLAGGGQNNSSQREEKVKIEDATERQGNKIKLKPGFEFYREGNDVRVRRYSAGTKVSSAVDGYIICTCGGGQGECTTEYNFNTKVATCLSSGCDHCNISYQRG